MKKIDQKQKINTMPILHKSRYYDAGGLSLDELITCLADDDRVINKYDSRLRLKQRFITEDIKAKDFPQKSETETLKQEFNGLIKQWVSDIQYKSLESQQINHPAFLRIIAIGSKFLPFVFAEFSKRPFMAWLKALPAIVGQDVASEAKSFPEALNLWREWAKENGYLPK